MTCLSNHERGADLLIGYLEDTLPAAERAEMDRHAQTCAECRELLEVQQTLDEYEAPPVSADFDARLYARIAAEQSQRSWWRGWFRIPAIPVAVAAAALAVVFVVREPAPDPDTKAVVDVEQLEQALEDLELLMPLESL